MKRRTASFDSPAVEQAARHLGSLVRQARLARQWTVVELAERARIGTATLKRLERGASSVSLGVWLLVFESLGLLRLLSDLEDPVSAAILNETQSKRARRKDTAADLDF